MSSSPDFYNFRDSLSLILKNAVLRPSEKVILIFLLNADGEEFSCRIPFTPMSEDDDTEEIKSDIHVWYIFRRFSMMDIAHGCSLSVKTVYNCLAHLHEIKIVKNLGPKPLQIHLHNPYLNIKDPVTDPITNCYCIIDCKLVWTLDKTTLFNGKHQIIVGYNHIFVRIIRSIQAEIYIGIILY